MNQLLAMRAFVRVVESGSFNRAVDQIALVRSNLSKLVSDLEKHFGTKLIYKTTRTIAVKAEGIDYFHQAMRIIAAVDGADTASKKNASHVDIYELMSRFLLPTIYLFLRYLIFTINFQILPCHLGLIIE